MANDESPANLLDNLLSPQQIAERIKASSGVTLATRTIWEKARRVGISKKIGRELFIHVDDIPKLLEPEKSKSQRIEAEAYDRKLRDSLRSLTTEKRGRGRPKSKWGDP